MSAPLSNTLSTSQRFPNVDAAMLLPFTSTHAFCLHTSRRYVLSTPLAPRRRSGSVTAGPGVASMAHFFDITPCPFLQGACDKFRVRQPGFMVVSCGHVLIHSKRMSRPDSGLSIEQNHCRVQVSSSFVTYCRRSPTVVHVVLAWKSTTRLICRISAHDTKDSLPLTDALRA